MDNERPDCAARCPVWTAVGTGPRHHGLSRRIALVAFVDIITDTTPVFASTSP
jgi:hypothetical protein